MADLGTALTLSSPAVAESDDAVPVRKFAAGQFLLLAAVALITRLGELRSWIANGDEQFYLFVGKAMLRGELPYVNVWDRKPIGLFLIYEAIAALGGNSVILYHCFAAAAALGTACVIVKLGEQFASRTGALRAGIAYLFLLPTMGGGGGQSPVFYNLLIAGAALLACQAFVLARRPVWPRAFAAMVLCGVAIQIKPTSLFEGAFIGLLFLASEWNQRRAAARVAFLASMMIVVALIPTIAAFGVYAYLGHFHEIWTATVVSVFTKAPLAWSERANHLPQFALFFGIPLAGALFALFRQYRARRLDQQTVFLGGWLIAALLGYLSVPNFFDHYALPLMVPVTVLLSLPLDGRRGMLWLAAVLAGPLLFISNSPSQLVKGDPEFDRAARLVESQLHGGCLYVYFGPTALYTATNACHLSAFVFPDHLESAVEAKALPVSPELEVTRIFARKPTVVVTQARQFLNRNNATAAIVERNLACDYRLAGQFRIMAETPTSIWVLRDRRPGTCPASHAALGIVQN